MRQSQLSMREFASCESMERTTSLEMRRPTERTTRRMQFSFALSRVSRSSLVSSRNGQHCCERRQQRQQSDKNKCDKRVSLKAHLERHSNQRT